MKSIVLNDYTPGQYIYRYSTLNQNSTGTSKVIWSGRMEGLREGGKEGMQEEMGNTDLVVASRSGRRDDIER